MQLKYKIISLLALFALGMNVDKVLASSSKEELYSIEDNKLILENAKNNIIALKQKIKIISEKIDSIRKINHSEIIKIEIEKEKIKKLIEEKILAIELKIDNNNKKFLARKYFDELRNKIKKDRPDTNNSKKAISDGDLEKAIESDRLEVMNMKKEMISIINIFDNKIKTIKLKLEENEKEAQEDIEKITSKIEELILLKQHIESLIENKN
jgi:hypothetical protein